MRTLIAPVLIAIMATPTLAADRVGYISIASGDLAHAESTLVAERRIFPNRPELMLNLAAVYQRTGRDAAARDLYRSVREKPAVMMDMPSGKIMSSHDLADRGIARLTPAVFATR
ncbi:hypothetical protein ASG67_06800 [Sphingomonas sp. Leaf339]|nr:hypothetical protein ASG67_06800 [Sphingomonas sp. Leaf339]